MSDYTDWLAEQQRQQEAQARATQQALDALRSLLPGSTPSGGDVSRAANQLLQEGRDPSMLRIALASQGENKKALAAQWLQDPKKREQLRAMLRGDATAFDTAHGGGQAIPQSDVLGSLNQIPVAFIRPDLSVRRDEVDTPEEVTRFLQKYHSDDPVSRQILQAAVNYGGLGVEPTPFGTVNSPGRGLQWQRKSNQPGDLEDRILRAHTGGGALSPSELSAIAQEREGNFRLTEPKQWQRQIAQTIGAIDFGIAGGYLGGALAGPLLAGAGLAGGGAGASVGAIGAAPTAGAAGSFIGGSPTLFGIGTGIGAGAASGGLSTAAATGDPDAIWRAALTGGVTGGLAPGLSSLVGPNPGAGISALTGAGTAGAGSLVSQALKNGKIDWRKLIQALGSGGVSGAASAMPGQFPGENIVTSLGTGVGSSFLNNQDPLAGPNAQLDRQALQNEQDSQVKMQQAQEDWKRRFGAASAEAMAAMQDKLRAYQDAVQSHRAEIQAKVQAMIDARRDQIAQALRAMGLAEPGVASFMDDYRKDREAQQQQAEADKAKLVESRNFFPSELLTQTGDTGASSLLVPHSPPPVLFGQEGLPASFTDYSQAGPPAFSAEGLLPSGSLMPPPTVAPPASGPGRSSRYFPTLLNGLTRSPYLRYA